jgi:hypothetical protein
LAARFSAFRTDEGKAASPGFTTGAEAGVLGLVAVLDGTSLELQLETPMAAISAIEIIVAAIRNGDQNLTLVGSSFLSDITTAFSQT